MRPEVGARDALGWQHGAGLYLRTSAAWNPGAWHSRHGQTHHAKNVVSVSLTQGAEIIGKLEKKSGWGYING